MTKINYAVRLETKMVKEEAFPYNREKLDSVDAVKNFMADLRDSDIEKFIVLYLNNQLKLNCIQIFPGTIDRADISIREVIKHALCSASNSIILVHNHPSGSGVFSEADVDTSQTIFNICKVVGITLLDHVLIAGDDAYSMKGQGLI